MAECVGTLAASYVTARAEEGGKKAAGGLKGKGKEVPPEGGGAGASAAKAGGGAAGTPRRAPLAPPPFLEAACHRADVAATLYQLLSNRLLTHHEMASLYTMLEGHYPEPPGPGADADAGGAWLIGALLRLEGQGAAALGGVMDAMFELRREYLPALRSARDFEVCCGSHCRAGLGLRGGSRGG